MPSPLNQGPRWIDEFAGSETQPRLGFDSQLADTLQQAWSGHIVGVGQPERSGGPTPMAPPTQLTPLTPLMPLAPLTPVSSISGRRPSPTWAKAMAWAAAGIIVIAGVVALANRNSSVGPAPVTDSTAAVSPTSSVAGPSLSSSTSPATGSTIPATSTAPTTSIIESTTLAPSSTAVPTTIPAVLIPSTPEEQTVMDYLTALSDGRYESAAKLLGEGGLELESRADLRPLFNDAEAMPPLADALRRWCQGGLCQVPSKLTTSGNIIVASFTVGSTTRSTSFVAGTFEGSPLVHGLPLQLLNGATLEQTVACDTESIDNISYADLNGDGWAELVTVHRAPAGARITVCGTSLGINPLDVGSMVRAYSLDIEGDGTDELMLATLLDNGMSGSLYRRQGSALVATGQAAQQTTPAGADLPGTSFGCTDVNNDGTRDFAAVQYFYLGGTDLSNSQALDYTLTIILPGGQAGASISSTYELPAKIDEAFRMIAGYCGTRSVQTG